MSKRNTGYPKLAQAQLVYQPEQGHILVAKDVAKGGIKRYYVYKSISEFLKDQEGRSKTYYEVIDGRMSQRLYFDIDIPITSDISKEGTDSFVLELLEHIKKCADSTEINVYTSHTVSKLSYHIVVQDLYLSGSSECKRKASEIVKSFKHPYTKYIDLSLYKSSQLFRLLGNAKMDSENYKTAWLGSGKFEDSLICH